MHKSPSFPTPHQSITTIEQTAAISTGRETLLVASTELKAPSTNTHTYRRSHTHIQEERETKWNWGKGEEIHTKDALQLVFLFLLVRWLQLFLLALVLMASLPASPRGDIFPCYSKTDTEEHRNRREIDKRRADIPCYNREMLAYQNLIKCWLALFLKMLLKAPWMADGGGSHCHIHTHMGAHIYTQPPFLSHTNRGKYIVPLVLAEENPCMYIMMIPATRERLWIRQG